MLCLIRQFNQKQLCKMFSQWTIVVIQTSLHLRLQVRAIIQLMKQTSSSLARRRKNSRTIITVNSVLSARGHNAQVEVIRLRETITSLFFKGYWTKFIHTSSLHKYICEVFVVYLRKKRQMCIRTLFFFFPLIWRTLSDLCDDPFRTAGLLWTGSLYIKYFTWALTLRHQY